MSLKVANAIQPVRDCLERDIQGSPVLSQLMIHELIVQILKEPGRCPEQQSHAGVPRPPRFRQSQTQAAYPVCLFRFAEAAM